jgi:hypothetical protein
MNSNLVCDLSALTPEEREQHSAVFGQLRGLIQEVDESPDGYGLRLADEPGVIRLAAEFIDRERRCCPFFDFTLEVMPDHGPIWLHLSGRDGVQAEGLRAELDLGFNPSPQTP